MRLFTPCLAAVGLIAVGCTGGLEGPAGPNDDAAAARQALQPMHRLNRLEYNNTVHDLLGTSLRPADAFAPDTEADGFDNMAAALQLTPGLLDSYYAAARAVVDDALDDRPAFDFVWNAADLVVPGGYPVGNVVSLEGNPFTVQATAPAGGASLVLLAGGSFTAGNAAAPTMNVVVDGFPVADFTVGGSPANPAPHAYPVVLTEGAHTITFTPTNFVKDPAANTGNNIFVMRVSLRSDGLVQGPGRERILICDTTVLPADACYKRIIEHFAARAWRRPITAAESDELTSLWAKLRQGEGTLAGETDDQALRLVMRAVLVSPKFLFRVRTVRDNDQEGWLDPYVLASRLSYFLWSTMPDERLTLAAESGALSNEAGIVQTVTWMLADEKSNGLLDGFAEQWLSTRRLMSARPSAERFPEFDEPLRQAMAAESKAFFRDLLTNGAPVASILDPGALYLNDRLAAHYGLPAVGSTDTVRVESDGTRPTGIFALSAWLTAESDPDRSSPIRRGRWLSDHVLCDPVPPPPPGLKVDPIPFTNDSTVRAQLELHRSNPACATCHSRLDVLGMGLEEFDGIGRLRAEPGIDTLGELPGGVPFAGAAALSQGIDSERVVACMTSKLFSYALGRGTLPTERTDIATIAATAVADGVTLPELITTIVLTPAFHAPATRLKRTP